MVYYDELYGGVLQGDGNSGGSGGGADLIGGNRISIGGETISFVNSADIVNVTGNSVTLQPDTAYKIYATASAVTINANPPAAGKWAYEGHLEIFVASTGYIVTGTNVVLANALEPDAVNNCVVRFHDGVAIIDVEDHVAGYIVVNGATSGDGSLYYGISTSTNDYVAFDASLNGTTIPLAGAVAEGEKHIVGNGYTSTTLTGTVDCGTSKFTVANLSLNNVQVNGGTLTLGDAYIPSGSTVAVSGGGLAVERVTGDGGVIDLGGTHVAVPSGVTVSASGCTFSGGRATTSGGAFNLYNAQGSFVDCMFIGNRVTGTIAFGGAVVCGATVTTFSSCTFVSNFCQRHAAAGALGGGRARFVDCTFTDNGGAMFVTARTAINGCVFGYNQTIEIYASNTLTLEGSNAIYSVAGSSGSVIISSGATLDLTGNTKATPIAPGGGITFASGGATVQLGSSAGTVDSSYMLDNVTLPAGAKLTNTAVVDLGGSYIDAAQKTVNITGATITSGSNLRGGGINATSATATITDTTITGCYASGNGGGLYIVSGTAHISNGIISGNSSVDSRTDDIAVGSGGVCYLKNCTASRIACGFDGAVVIESGNNTVHTVSQYQGSQGVVTISAGANITLGGKIQLGTAGTVNVVGGTCAVNTHVIGSGTYTQINSNGTTVPATDADGNTNPIA